MNAGDPVVVVGFGGIGRRCGPSLTCGILSKAIILEDKPVMLQTTCAVQAGTSGGAVVHRLSGKLLGKGETYNPKHLSLITSRGHMENTFGYTRIFFAYCMIVFQILQCIYISFIFCRNCVQQYKRHHHQSNVSTSQLQHPSERLPGSVAALRGDKGHKCLQGAGHDRGESQKGLEVTSQSEQNVTQPRQRHKSQWGPKDWIVKLGPM